MPHKHPRLLLYCWAAWSFIYFHFFLFGKIARIIEGVLFSCVTIGIVIFGIYTLKMYRMKKNAVHTSVHIQNNNRASIRNYSGEKLHRHKDIITYRICVFILLFACCVDYWFWIVYGRLFTGFSEIFLVITEAWHIWIAAALTLPWDGKQIKKAYNRLFLKGFVFEFFIIWYWTGEARLINDVIHPLDILPPTKFISSLLITSLVQSYAVAIYVYKLRNKVIKTEVPLWHGMGYLEKDENGNQHPGRNTFGI